MFIIDTPKTKLQDKTENKGIFKDMLSKFYPKESWYSDCKMKHLGCKGKRIEIEGTPSKNSSVGCDSHDQMYRVYLEICELKGIITRGN